MTTEPVGSVGTDDGDASLPNCFLLAFAYKGGGGYLKAARRLEDLFLIKSLHYEKKKGDLNGVDTVWINDQYHLFFYSTPDNDGIIVNALLFEISKHYFQQIPLSCSKKSVLLQWR